MTPAVRLLPSRAASKPWRFFSHPQDWHCVLFHFICLTAYACAFWLYLHPKVAGIAGPWSRAAFVLASAMVLGWISGIDVGVNFHNHSHRPIHVAIRQSMVWPVLDFFRRLAIVLLGVLPRYNSSRQFAGRERLDPAQTFGRRKI